VAVAGIKKLVDVATLPEDDEFTPGLHAYFAIATHEPGVTAAPMKFEVTTLPVADVDRAKAFYQGLG
jgi:hypothetical protein